MRADRKLSRCATKIATTLTCINVNNNDHLAILPLRVNNGAVVGALMNVGDEGIHISRSEFEALRAQLDDLQRQLSEYQGGRSHDRAQMARTSLRARRERDRYFAPQLFADPAWDMLLDLYAAHHEGRLVSVSSLCIAAAVPATTALRWITKMVKKGYFLRGDAVDDGRRIYVGLSGAALSSLDGYFDEGIRRGWPI